MAKSRDPYFYRTVLDPSQDDNNPEITLAPVQVTVSKNFLFDIISKVWRYGSGDAFGRTRITSGPPNLNAIVPKTITVLSSETLILDNNPNRQGAIIDNISFGWFYMALRTGDIAALNYVFFPNDFYLEIDGYTGQLFMQSAYVGTDQITVLEY